MQAAGGDGLDVNLSAPRRRACGASHAMAQAPPLPLIFHGKIRRQSGGRAKADSSSHPLETHSRPVGAETIVIRNSYMPSSAVLPG